MYEIKVNAKMEEKCITSLLIKISTTTKQHQETVVHQTYTRYRHIRQDANLMVSMLINTSCIGKCTTPTTIP